MTEKGMFGLQREGTVLKGRGRSQRAEHENEEAQVDEGLTECPAVMLSDPQSMRSAAQAGPSSPPLPGVGLWLTLLRTLPYFCLSHHVGEIRP